MAMSSGTYVFASALYLKHLTECTPRLSISYRMNEETAEELRPLKRFEDADTPENRNLLPFETSFL